MKKPSCFQWQCFHCCLSIEILLKIKNFPLCRRHRDNLFKMSSVLTITFLITFVQFTYSLLVILYDILSDIQSEALVRFMCKHYRYFFRSLIYSTMLSENVRQQGLSHIHFINGLGKIGKGVGVSRCFYFMSGGPTPIDRTYTKCKLFVFLYVTQILLILFRYFRNCSLKKLTSNSRRAFIAMKSPYFLIR